MAVTVNGVVKPANITITSIQFNAACQAYAHTTADPVRGEYDAAVRRVRP